MKTHALQVIKIIIDIRLRSNWPTVYNSIQQALACSTWSAPQQSLMPLYLESSKDVAFPVLVWKRLYPRLGVGWAAYDVKQSNNRTIEQSNRIFHYWGRRTGARKKKKSPFNTLYCYFLISFQMICLIGEVTNKQVRRDVIWSICVVLIVRISHIKHINSTAMSDVWNCGYINIWICEFLDMWICGYAEHKHAQRIKIVKLFPKFQYFENELHDKLVMLAVDITLINPPCVTHWEM